MTTILFVDDDYLTLETYSKIFSLSGYEVFLAASGKKALEMVEYCDFDLIVVDMRLPEMDGFALLRQLKIHPLMKGIPIVMVSAGPDIYAKEAIDAGAQHYISKPVFPQKIKEIIEDNRSITRDDHVNSA